MAFARQRSMDGAGTAPRGMVSEPAMQRGRLVSLPASASLAPIWGMVRVMAGILTLWIALGEDEGFGWAVAW